MGMGNEKLASILLQRSHPMAKEMEWPNKWEDVFHSIRREGIYWIGYWLQFILEEDKDEIGPEIHRREKINGHGGGGGHFC